MFKEISRRRTDYEITLPFLLKAENIFAFAFSHTTGRLYAGDGTDYGTDFLPEIYLEDKGEPLPRAPIE